MTDQSRTQPSIVVVGSTMIDMIAYVTRVPAAGETIVGERFAQGFGGKGANQAVMASRLGANVSMVNCLGDDMFGTITIENFTREGIDVSHITRAEGISSGVAPIWVERDGTNRIVCVPGANDHMTTEQARAAVDSAATVDVVLGQFEAPQPVTAAGFAAAKARGAATVLNPAPAADLSEDLLRVTDWLVPNEVEFAHLAAACGVPAGSPAGSVPDEAIAAVATKVGKRLVVTLGEQGAAVCENGRDVLRVPAPVVTAIDTTGAGDAFVGGFAYGLALGLSAFEAATLGCECGSTSVTGNGTQSSFLSREDAAELHRRLGTGG